MFASLRQRSGASFLLAAVLAFVAFSLFRAGFYGGVTDDQQYLDAAQAWYAHSPVLGTTHWALRHPLVLSIAGSFALLGESVTSAMWIPTLFGLLLALAGFAILRRQASPRAAWIWLALILLNPAIHEMGTSLFPEIVELALAGTGLALVWSAAETKGAASGRLIVAGLLFGLAALTRETAVLLAPLIGWIVWRTRGLRGLAILGAAALAPVIVDTMFLHAMSGDWLYRLHVDSAHTKIASAHLRGGTFDGRPFLNTELAARWIPAGPTRLHWAVNPLGDFLIDPKFGFLPLGAIVATLLWRAETRSDRRLHRAAAAMALLAYAGVCWILMLRPQPRYFLFVMLAASVSLALILDRAWTGRRRRLAIGLFILLCAAGLFGVVRQHDHERLPRLVMPYLRTHPGVYHTDPITARRVNRWLVEDQVPTRLVASPPQVGDLILRREKFVPPANEQRQSIAIIDGGEQRWWERRSLKRPRPMIVERRVR